MSKHISVKKSLILLVAALLAVAVLFSACNGQAFKPVSMPDAATPESNGGIAVKYGNWIYYVNGYESNVNAENTYVDTTDAPRVGSVVRLDVTKLEEILKVYDEPNMTTTKQKEKIAELVNEYTEVVVPKIYYSGNTTTAQFNGIWIFNNRLYMLTPNDKLTAAGSPLTSESVLMSFKLDGSDPIRHFTFSSNAAQVKMYLDPSDNTKVMATYLMDSKLYVLDIDNSNSVSTAILGDDDTASSVSFVADGNRVFYINSADGAIYQLVDGAREAQMVVKNTTDWKISYTIESYANEYVYYTVSYEENSDRSGKVLYYATYSEAAAQADEAETDTETEAEYAATRTVACDTKQFTSSIWKGWKENNIVVVNEEDGYYGLYIICSTSGRMVQVLKEGFNNANITIDKIVGDTLYYTAGSVSYTKNLGAFVEGGEVVENEAETISKGVAYAYGWSMAATLGWASADLVTIGGDTYMFTVSSGSVAIAKFDPENENNGTSTILLKTAVED